MTKHEGELKTAFRAELKRQLPHFIMQQMATNGSPDRCITGNGRTSFWEMKHGTPDFVSHGDQELMCQRLAVQGYCRYVLWTENRFGQCKQTRIILPRAMAARTDWVPLAETFCVGFNHKWLVEHIKKAHGLL